MDQNSHSAVRNWALASATLWLRELKRFHRQRSRVIGALGMPLLFWVVIGSGFGRSIRLPGESVESAGREVLYLEYFFPGTIVMIVLFTSIFSTISVIDDRREGFLLSVLVAPVPRFCIVFGKVFGGATLGFFQGFLFTLTAPLLGYPLGLVQFILLFGILFLIAVGLTGMSFFVAWRSESTQGFHAIMNLVFIPMWLLSGALFPIGGATGWMQWVIKLNPLTYGMAAVRHVFYADNASAAATLPSFPLSLGVTSLFLLMTLIASFYAANRKIKGVSA